MRAFGTVITLVAGVALASCTSAPDRPEAAPSASTDPSSSVSPHLAPSTTRPERTLRPVECFHRRSTITGTSRADRLKGTAGRDVIAALGGDDVVLNAGGKDWVCTGAGHDTVRAVRRTIFPWVFGVDLGRGDDRLHFPEATQIFGGAGNDRIVVDRGVGGISGGRGSDYLRAGSPTRPSGDPYNTPCLSFGPSPQGVYVDLAVARARGEGSDTIVGFRCVHGSRYGDRILGSDTRDDLSGGAGPDLIRAGAGDDAVKGGAGDDRIYLESGIDYGNGESGRDRLYGESGPDVLEGWTHSDYLEGGSGNDQVYGAIFCAIGGNSYDTNGMLDGAPDEMFGGTGDDYLVGDRGNDRIDGGAGHDWAQPGHHDGRIDWVEDVEAYVNGCLENVTMDQPLDPSRVRDDEPW